MSYESESSMPYPDNTGRLRHSLLRSTLAVMYPGRTFGVGLEVPYYWHQIQLQKSRKKPVDYSYKAVGDIQLVAKYQFGLYRHYRLFNRQRLLNMAMSIVAKLKLPSADEHLARTDAEYLPAMLQPGNGSTDLAIGVVFHTDTPEWFRIHSHLTISAPLAWDRFRPGERINFTVNYIFARLGWRDRYFPFLALKGWLKRYDKLDNSNLQDSGGIFLYLTPGVRTTWWYFSNKNMFLMLEGGLPIRMTGNRSEFGVYLGTRLFFR